MGLLKYQYWLTGLLTLILILFLLALFIKPHIVDVPKTVITHHDLLTKLNKSTFLDPCLDMWKNSSVSRMYESVYDFRCINRAGTFDTTHYYHILVDCLVPMSPKLAYIIDLSIKSPKQDIVIITNSEMFKSWIHFFLPSSVTIYSSLSFLFREDAARQKLTFNASSHNYTNCILMLQEIGSLSLNLSEQQLRQRKHSVQPKSMSNGKILNHHRASVNHNNILYIKRNSRDISNIDEVRSVLMLSFPSSNHIYFYGNESSKETFAIFSIADVVIGYHGAGLANVIFCKPQVLVIEVSIWIYHNQTVPWRSNIEIFRIFPTFIWKTIYLPLNSSDRVNENYAFYEKAVKHNHIIDLDHFFKISSVKVSKHDINKIRDLISSSLRRDRAETYFTYQ